MGSGLSPIVADLVMMDVEENMSQLDNFKNVQFYRRYRDDGCILWKGNKGSLEEFVEDLNTLDKDIKFTVELEKEEKLPYLDTLLIKEEKEIKFRVYSKPYASGIKMDYSSFHERRTINNIILGETIRFCRISDYEEEDLKSLENIFEENHYPKKVIKKQISKGRKILEKKSGKTKEKEKKGYLVLPYLGKKKSKQINKLGNRFNFKVAYKKRKNLKCLLSKSFKNNNSIEAGIIYNIRCECKESYIGETGGLLSKRIKQHQNSVKSRDLTNGPAAHKESCDKFMMWKNPTILAREGNWLKRKITEGLFIQKDNPSINLKNGFPIVGKWN